ncbi:MAG: DUF2927 domain-containing protein [Planktomarina sp.]
MRVFRYITFAAATFAVTACTLQTVPDDVVDAPQQDLVQWTGPDVPSEPDAEIASVASPRSSELRLYYARIANELRSSGGLKQSSDTVTAPAEVARIFKSLAFANEFTNTTEPLQRWGGSMRVRLRFGPSVNSNETLDLGIKVHDLLPRFAITTGLSIERGDPANLHIFFVNEGERRALGPVLQDSIPGMALADITRITSMPRTEQCLVMAFEGPVPHTRNQAIVIIREELPPILKLACLHEEIAQAIGLTNDHPDARPSIFNDDDEYATLTGLDLDLLRLLYHPDLKTGMTLDTATPIIDRIVATAPQTGG